MEPRAGPSAARGVVDGHGSGVKGGIAFGSVGFADEGRELFLLVFLRGGVGRDFADIGPDRRVYIVGGGVELYFGVWQFVEEGSTSGVPCAGKDCWGGLLPAGDKGGVFDVGGGREAEASVVD